MLTSPKGPELEAQAHALNARFQHRSAPDILHAVLRDRCVGDVAMVSSFGADSVVLLHLIAVTAPDTPILFIDTQMLFTETLVYQQELTERLGLKALRIVTPAPARIAAQDPDGQLNQSQPDACCHLRKTDPLQTALTGYDAWITGRKRFQATTRQALPVFEVEAAAPRIKVNPLAHWTAEDLQTYMAENRLPRHPLVARGYPSIGCAPCTRPVAPGDDPRSGRWAGQTKTECGLHLPQLQKDTTP